MPWGNPLVGRALSVITIALLSVVVIVYVGGGSVIGVPVTAYVGRDVWAEKVLLMERGGQG